MRRRKFIALLGGAGAWPVALKAQQAEPVRRVGVFFGLEPDDAEAQARTTVFAQALEQLGWAVGRNLVIDTRLVGGDIDERLRRDAADLVGAGLVQSMAHPGGNITGFSNFEYSMGGKWAELLKQIAPHVTRALVLRDPTAATGIGLFAAVGR